MISRRNTPSNNLSKSKDRLVKTRSSLMYGISIIKDDQETVSTNRGLVSIPNIMFHTGNTKCIIDFSNPTNSEIENKIKKYFSQIDINDTFTITNGTYTDPISNETADVSGTYVFKQLLGSIVEANVTSVEYLNNKISTYHKANFEQIPVFKFDSINDSSDVKIYFKNKFGKNSKNSFNYLGIKIGDYIKLTNLTTPVEVVNIKTDQNGAEIIEVNATLTEQDYSNERIAVELYVLTDIDTSTKNIDITDTRIGACIEYFNGAIISCTDNNTVSQCNARAKIGYTTEITPGTFCATPETSTAIQKTTTDNLVQITSTLADAVINISNTTKRNKFYGRNF